MANSSHNIALVGALGATAYYNYLGTCFLHGLYWLSEFRVLEVLLS